MFLYSSARFITTDKHNQHVWTNISCHKFSLLLSGLKIMILGFICLFSRLSSTILKTLVGVNVHWRQVFRTYLNSFHLAYLNSISVFSTTKRTFFILVLVLKSRSIMQGWGSKLSHFCGVASCRLLRYSSLWTIWANSLDQCLSVSVLTLVTVILFWSSWADVSRVFICSLFFCTTA